MKIPKDIRVFEKNLPFTNVISIKKEHFTRETKEARVSTQISESIVII